MNDEPQSTGAPPPAPSTGAPPPVQSRTLPPRACNICGSSEFEPGFAGRLRGGLPPQCARCKSAERHRAARTVYEKLKPLGQWWRVLHFAPDTSVDPAWFALYRPSTFGRPSGLDMLDTGLPDAAFDVVISNHVLEHVPDFVAGLRETLRVVGPFGIVHCMVPANSWGLDDWGFADPARNAHYREFGADFAVTVQKILGGVKALGIACGDPVTGAADMIYLFARSTAPLIGIHRLLIRRGTPVVRFFDEPEPAAGDIAARLAAAAAEAANGGEWAAAVERWGACIKFFPQERSLGDWLDARAAAWLRLGRHADAESDYRSLVALFPTRKTKYTGLAQQAERSRDYPAVAAASDEPLARFPESPDPDWRVQRALASDDLAGASAALCHALAAAQTIQQVERAFERAPAVLQGWARRSFWLDLERRARTLAAAAPATGIAPTGAQSRDSHAILRLRLLLALRNYEEFLESIAALPDTVGDRRLGGMRRTATLLRSARFPDFGARKIFGIGLARTGAQSLTKALHHLGFHTAHETNPFTGEILCLDDAFLFDGYTGSPACVIFDTLYYTFPNAKFIHTVRPTSSWIASFNRHFRARASTPTGAGAAPPGAALPGAAAGVGLHGVERALSHGALYDRYTDPLAARAAHEARVRQFISAGDATRFLEFDVFAGDGWEKLCAFVNRPIPEGAFPWVNRHGAAGPPPAEPPSRPHDGS